MRLIFGIMNTSAHLRSKLMLAENWLWELR